MDNFIIGIQIQMQVGIWIHHDGACLYYLRFSLKLSSYLGCHHPIRARLRHSRWKGAADSCSYLETGNRCMISFTIWLLEFILCWSTDMIRLEILIVWVREKWRNCKMYNWQILQRRSFMTGIMEFKTTGRIKCRVLSTILSSFDNIVNKCNIFS